MEIMNGTAIESSPTRLSMRRAFLCDASSTHAPADRAAQFCIAGVGQDAPTLDASGAIDLSRTLVVLPGSRARRLFLRALSEAVGNHPLIPPETTTVGGAEALLFDAPITVASTTRVAPSSVERLAWAHVLSDPRAAILLHQVEGAAPLNLAQRFDAARVVLSAISELDKALLTAEGVAEVAAKLGENELAARWCAIDELSIDVGAWLKKRGFHAACSPRARAWGAPSGMFDRVVLVGLAEVRPSLRHALRTSNADVVACVFATEVDASRFDAYGVPDDSFAAPLAFERIELAPCADIADLTERLVAWVSDAVDGPVHAAAEDFTFAMVDESMAQPVARMCESHGLSLHLAEGTPLAMTLVGRLVIDLDRAFSEQSSNARSRKRSVQGHHGALRTPKANEYCAHGENEFVGLARRDSRARICRTSRAQGCLGCRTHGRGPALQAARSTSTRLQHATRRLHFIARALALDGFRACAICADGIERRVD